MIAMACRIETDVACHYGYHADTAIEYKCTPGRQILCTIAVSNIEARKRRLKSDTRNLEIEIIVIALSVSKWSFYLLFMAKYWSIRHQNYSLVFIPLLRLKNGWNWQRKRSAWGLNWLGRLIGLEKVLYLRGWLGCEVCILTVVLRRAVGQVHKVRLQRTGSRDLGKPRVYQVDQHWSEEVPSSINVHGSVEAVCKRYRRVSVHYLWYRIGARMLLTQLWQIFLGFTLFSLHKYYV